ncbi:unnamed protein product [Mytilus edulis]|uniref:Uncharacterized protein n=1 Tax=Mytilus edulis TaxID=6550 RepID=A0A8S3VCT1_MYTED|nr:unnamed protein product [Mytilus edulis]
MPDPRIGPDKNSDIEEVTELTDTNQVESAIVCADNLVDLTDQVNETESANVSTAYLMATTDHIVTLENHSHEDNNKLAIIEHKHSEEHIDIIIEKAMEYYPELKRVIYGDILSNNGNVDPFDTVHVVGESQAVLHVNQEIKYESTTVQLEQLNLITLQLSNETVNLTFQDIFAFTTGLKSPPPLGLNPEPSIAFLHVENLNHRLEKKDV